MSASTRKRGRKNHSLGESRGSRRQRGRQRGNRVTATDHVLKVVLHDARRLRIRTSVPIRAESIVVSIDKVLHGKRVPCGSCAKLVEKLDEEAKGETKSVAKERKSPQ